MKIDASIKIFLDGLSELTFVECGENGPYDMDAPKVHPLGKVKKVSITECSWGKKISSKGSSMNHTVRFKIKTGLTVI